MNAEPHGMPRPVTLSILACTPVRCEFARQKRARQPYVPDNQSGSGF